MHSSTVTAIIPAYNAERLVDRAVTSMLGQSEPPAEVIVVDDGSRDSTASIAAAAGARVIRQNNRGPGAARNTGIRASATPWIALLDADDRSRPERLEREMSVAASRGDVDVVFAGIDVPGRTPTAAPPHVDFRQLWRKNVIATSTVLLRKTAWQEVGGFDESPDLIGVEDYNLWLRLANAGCQFACAGDVLVDYRPTAASLTAQTRRFAAAELANVRHIAAQVALSPADLASKEQAVYLEYGLELFFQRDWAAAREYLGRAAERGPIGLAAQLRRIVALCRSVMSW